MQWWQSFVSFISWSWGDDVQFSWVCHLISVWTVRCFKWKSDGAGITTSMLCVIDGASTSNFVHTHLQLNPLSVSRHSFSFRVSIDQMSSVSSIPLQNSHMETEYDEYSSWLSCTMSMRVERAQVSSHLDFNFYDRATSCVWHFHLSAFYGFLVRPIASIFAYRRKRGGGIRSSFY